MKTEFKLDTTSPYKSTGEVKIIGLPPKYKPYLSFRITTPNGIESSGCLPDKDIERFAVNILKALKSSKLKSKSNH
jgi:hypothetical protein